MMDIIRWDGNPISKPGLYEKVPLSIYHSGRLCVGPSISHSGLHRIVSPEGSEAHFYDTWPLNPDRNPDADDDSEAIILGRATHHLLLGEPNFKSEFVVTPDRAPDAKGVMGLWNGNKTYCQEWLATRKAEGMTVLKPAWVERIKGMAMSLSRQPLVRQGALNGLIETTMAWFDEETRVWLLNRPDVIPTDSGDVVDLKTIRSTAPHVISRTIGERGYHMQGALVKDGFKTVTGTDMASFSLYFIESDRPHCCALYRLTDRDLKIGHDLYRAALKRFVLAVNTGEWPGPGGPQTVERYMSISERQRALDEAIIARSAT